MDWDEQYDKIYRYCYFRLHHQQTAEDITQDAFLRFLENKDYREQGRSLRYLYTIARNLCIDAYRKKQREAAAEEFLEESFSTENPSAKNLSVGNPFTENLLYESSEEAILTGIVVRDAVRKLPREEQEILLLRYVNEVPVSDICGILKISRFSLYRKTAKILKKLRESLGKEAFR